MDARKIDRLERLLERELSTEEKERLRRIKDTLGIKDDDGMWDVLTAMEYQRKYYDELPGKIAASTAEIFNGLSQAAEKEVALAQGKLAESVVKQARMLATRLDYRTWFVLGMLMLAALLLYGALLLWAGYCIGSGQTHPPALLLKMPVGVIVGALCFCCGIFEGVLAAQHFSEGKAAWRKYLFAALGCMLPGGWVLSLAMF